MNSSQDKVIQFVVDAAANHTAVRRIYLFGSRAKGTQSERSDYDFGVEWDGGSYGESWGDFTGQIREKSPTLHQIDLARLDLCDEHLQNVILTEGILIYERKT